MKLNDRTISLMKQKFIDRYNEDASEIVARRKAVNAAVQHNVLYSAKIDGSLRASIREYWFCCLEEIGWEFKKNISIESYEVIIQKFKLHMNKRFGEAFDNESMHGSEFRLSHSQKSISVYLKHLWCLEKIREPNICPVDRVILSQTIAKKTNDCSWGNVNTIDVHRRKFKYILDQAKKCKLQPAVWELKVFNT